MTIKRILFLCLLYGLPVFGQAQTPVDLTLNPTDGGYGFSL
jgi:hypothetical protein